MTTECTTERLEFGGLRRQRVVGRFDGGELGSDGGGLLLRELAQRTGLFGRLSACFRDYREPQRTRHPVEVLVAARVLGLALGYEDLNDHDTLRQSKLWSLLCGAATEPEQAVASESSFTELVYVRSSTSGLPLAHAEVISTVTLPDPPVLLIRIRTVPVVVPV